MLVKGRNESHRRLLGWLHHSSVRNWGGKETSSCRCSRPPFSSASRRTDRTSPRNLFPTFLSEKVFPKLFCLFCVREGEPTAVVRASVERGAGDHFDRADGPNRNYLCVIVPSRNVLDSLLERRSGNPERNVFLALSSKCEPVEGCFTRALITKPEAILLCGQRGSRNAAASSGIVLRNPIRLCSSRATTGIFWAGIAPVTTLRARALSRASCPGR